jgi:hypothetical protein
MREAHWNVFSFVLTLALMYAFLWAIASCQRPPPGPCGYGNAWQTTVDGEIKCMEVTK